MPPGESDEVKAAFQRMDVMYDQMVDLNVLLKEMVKAHGNQNKQVVIHRTEGMGSVAIACAAISVLCVLFLIIVVVFVDGKLSAIEAWQGVFGRDLTAVHTQLNQKKEKDH